MLPQLVSLFLVFSKVYCQDEISNADSIPFSHDDLIVPLEEFNKNETLQRVRKVEQDHRISHYVEEASFRTDINNYCSSFRTCFECVKSVWHPCQWCHNLGCTNMGELLCPYAKTLKNSNANILKVCPFIQHKGPILLPSGLRSHITVKLNAPDPIINDMDIICQIKLKNRLTHLKGLILKDSIHCYPVKLDAAAYRETIHGSFRVIWGGYEPYSNEVPMTVYNCGGLADECDTCSALAPEFGCGWCDGLSSCVTANQCDDIMNWSLNRVTCKYIKKKMYFV